MKRKFFVFIGLLVFIITIIQLDLKSSILKTIHPNDSKYSPTACKKQGGRWIVTGPPAGEVSFCHFPPIDEGKICSEDSECEIHCITDRKLDDDGYYVGECGKYSIFDCRPHIPQKTKDKSKLQSGSCV